MSELGHTQKSGPAPAMSAPEKKQKFPNFIQNFIHRMSGAGGKAEVFRKHSQVRKVPIPDIRYSLATPTITRC